MALVGKLDVRLGMDTSDYAKGRQRAKQENKAFIDDVKSQFGERSQLGETLKALTGAGAVAGLSLAGHILDQVTTKAVELKAQFAAGTISAGEMTDQLARSLPVLGGIYSAGRNIRELITGEAAEVERIKLSTEVIDLHYAAVAARIKLGAEYAQKMADFTGEVQTKIERMALAGVGLKFFDINTETAQTFKKLIDDAGKAKASSDILGLQKQASDIRQRLSHTDQSSATFADDQAMLKRTSDQITKLQSDIDSRTNDALKSAAQLAVMQKGQALFGAVADGSINWISGRWKTFTEFMGRAADERAKLKAEATKVIEDSMSVGEKLSQDIFQLQTLRAAGFLTAQQFDTARLNAFNQAFGQTVETAAEYAKRMDSIREKNMATFAEFAKFSKGQIIPQASVDERRTSFITPSSTQPMAELKKTVEQGLRTVVDRVEKLTTQITKDPAGFLMQILGGQQ